MWNCTEETSFLSLQTKHGTGTFHWKLVKGPGSRKNSTSSVPSSPRSVWTTNAMETFISACQTVGKKVAL